jgi:hypothetical protein
MRRPAEFESILPGLLGPSAAAASDPLPEVASDSWSHLWNETPAALQPWLAYCLERRGRGMRWPSAMATRMATVRRSAAVGHLRRRVVLSRLLPALERAGVRAVVLKGAALAGLCYPEPALRTMGDLDLWVPASELDRAVAAALAEGVGYSGRLRNRAPAAWQPNRASTRVLECERTGVVVEVHGQVYSLRELSPGWHERAWQRLEQRSLDGIAGWVLHPEDMLTHLAVHCGRNDRFREGLKPLVDIALWVGAEGGRVDWTRLAGDWQQERVAAWSILVLRLARDLLDARVPDRLQSSVEDQPDFAPLRDLARQQVLTSGLKLPNAMAHLVAAPVPERLSWLLRRVTTWYWRGPPGVRRSAGMALRDALGRMGHDLRFKLGPYVHGLLTGRLLGSEFRRRRQVVLGQTRLASLAEQIEERSER